MNMKQPTNSAEMVIAQCPRCGANLDPDTFQSVTTCSYCGTPLIIKTYQESSNGFTGDHQGYELFWDQKQVGHESNWTQEQAVGNLLWNIGQYPEKKIEGRFGNQSLILQDNLFRYIVPKSISILPCFFVPKGERPPNDKQISRLVRHLEWARTRYAELLGEPYTFSMAGEGPKIITSPNDLAFFRSLQKKESHHLAGEVLHSLDHNRFSCPYVCFTVVQNEHDDFPTGCGYPFNGGFNTGGGIVFVSSYALNHIPNFQSTVQHELAHAFGLPHIDRSTFTA